MQCAVYEVASDTSVMGRAEAEFAVAVAARGCLNVART